VVNAAFGASTPAKPSPAKGTAASARKSPAVQSQLRAIAASAGISLTKLEAGLVAMKEAHGTKAEEIAAFAAATGVSHATAQRVFNAVTAM